MTEAQRNGIDVRVGRRVRMTRIFRDRNILDVARHLDVSVLEYAELEEGKRRFEAAQLMDLSRLFQVNVAMFFGEPAKFDLKKYHRPNPIAYFSTNDNRARRSARSE
jgi:transcriptional regulator with XRE-family HTH domain